MIAGEIKTRIDQIWDTFWTGGITNSSSNINHMDLKNQKENGKILSINTKKCIYAKRNFLADHLN